MSKPDDHHGIPQPTKKVTILYAVNPVKAWFDKLFKQELNSMIKQSKINKLSMIKQSKINNKNKI